MPTFWYKPTAKGYELEGGTDTRKCIVTIDPGGIMNNISWACMDIYTGEPKKFDVTVMTTGGVPVIDDKKKNHCPKK